MTLDLDHLIFEASIMTRDSDRLFIDVPLSNHEAKKEVNKLFKDKFFIPASLTYVFSVEYRTMEY